MMHIMIIHIPEKDHIAVCRSVCGDIVCMMAVMTVMFMSLIRSVMAVMAVMLMTPVRSMMAMMAVMFMVLMSAIRQYLLIFNSDLVLFIETAHRNTPSAPGGLFLFHFTHASDDGFYKNSAS